VGDGRLEVLHLEMPRRDLDEVRLAATDLSALFELEREPDLSGVD
jgi:hypothetical protein